MNIQSKLPKKLLSRFKFGLLLVGLALSVSSFAEGFANSGRWHSLDINGKFTFATYVAANDHLLAIAGLDASLKPAVWTCNPKALQNCTKPIRGLNGKASAPSALQFNAFGDLFAMFSPPVAAADNPNHTLIQKLPLGKKVWETFQSFGGMSLSLDVSQNQVLTGSTYELVAGPVSTGKYWGAIDLYDENGNLLATNLNDASSALTAVANDGLGRLYVAGPQLLPGSNTRGPYASVWSWSPSAPKLQSFNQILQGDSMVSITDMVGDGSGAIFIAGLNSQNQGQVLKYQNDSVTNTGLGAFQVASLVYSRNGYLVAAGQDALTYQGQVWVLDPSLGTWQSLNLQGAVQVVNVAVNSRLNQIFVVGTDRKGRSRIWAYY